MIVGKATKQPRETESYSVIYDDDLNDGESVVSSSHIIYNEKKLVDAIDIAADYAAVAADAFKAYRVTGPHTVTLPVGLVDGTEFYVGNASAADQCTVAASELIAGSATYLVGVNHSVIVKRVAGTWSVIATGDSVLVDTPTDHRTRVFFTGGEDKGVYVAEITADTDEGRILEDELRITVKETR